MKDANDILQNGGTDALRGHWDTAERRTGFRFPIHNLGDLKVSTMLRYFVKGIIPRSGLVVVWGPPKCGKSFWAYDLVMHIAMGWPYRDRPVQQGSVLYLALEGQERTQDRFEAWCRRHLTNGKRRTEVPFSWIDVSIDLIADHETLIAEIKLQVDSADVIVVDTVNRALAGDENSSADTAKFIRAADAIKRAFRCAVIVIHHCGVAGSRPRGHSSLSGADDAQIAVWKDDSGLIAATVEHCKDGEDGAVLCSRLERAEIGTDVRGDPITTCTITAADGETAAGKKATVTGKAKIALDALYELIASDGEVIASNHIPQQRTSVDVRLWRRCFYNRVVGEDIEDKRRNTKEKAFKRAIDRLQNLQKIGIWNDRVWPTGDERT